MQKPYPIAMYQELLSQLGHDISGQEKVSDVELLARKGNLRGLLWRLKLGVLPSSAPLVEELRRAVAEDRRKYAELRRRLLVDPHSTIQSHKSHLAKADNPLSQDPDSVWSRYFQISDLEETIDNDLARLYPEHGAFFHSPPCQIMLRRILLVWSLMHPSSSYRQGMHELLAPLLYVLLCDLVHLFEVKKRHEDLFDDGFEELLSFQLQGHESRGNQRTKRQMWFEAVCTTEGSGIEGSSFKRGVGLDFGSPQHVHELTSVLHIMVMGNATYGVEGELGVLLSERFVEHDAFSIFNALMSKESGGVKVADYFLAPNAAISTSGLSPAQEASSLLYRALASIDMVLYGHLKGLGVEPQFFALRWFRILFGREMSLQKLLILWDAIFSISESSGAITLGGGGRSLDGWHNAPRRVFILALAVSMLLYLRPVLLASHNATGCLQKLMNFPHNVEVEVLTERAMELMPVMEETLYLFLNGKNANGTGHSRKAPHNAALANSSPLSDFYCEEKWKSSVMQKVNQFKDQVRPEARRDLCHFNVQKGAKNPGTIARVLESKQVLTSGGKDGLQENGQLVADNRSGDTDKLVVRDIDPSSTALAYYASLDQSSNASAGCCGVDSNGPRASMSSPNETVKSVVDSRKYWLWNFGKRRNQGVKREEASPLLKNSDGPSKDGALIKGPPAETKCQLENEEQVDSRNLCLLDVRAHGLGEQDKMTGTNLCDVVLVRYDASNPDPGYLVQRSGQFTEPRTLGGLIRAKIEVIEAAISHMLISKTENCMSESSQLNGDMLGSPPLQAVPGVHETVEAAFKELRKISNQLLQM